MNKLLENVENRNHKKWIGVRRTEDVSVSEYSDSSHQDIISNSKCEAMSKRGRRRNSKRRKSSCSSKQSVSPYIFHKQNKSNSVSYNDIVEKGETDSLRKENVPSESEDEEKYNNASPKEKRFKRDYHLSSIYTKTTEDKEKGVRTVTSVSVNDVDDSSPQIIVQHSHELLSEKPSVTPVTDVMKINCTLSRVKIEIQDVLQLNVSGTKTTFVFMNEEGDCAQTFFKSKREKTWTRCNESPDRPSQNGTQHNQNTDYRFHFGDACEQTVAHSESINKWDNANDHKQFILTDCMMTNDPSNPPHPQKSMSSEEFWDIPPPQEFADLKCNTLHDLTRGLASCRIAACSPNITYNEGSEGAGETAPLFDQFSESANYEPVNRSNFTKDFINCQKKKSLIRHKSADTLEHKACLLPKKRHPTFPGMSEGLRWTQEDLVFPCSESFSSLVMCSLLLQTERLGRLRQGTSSFNYSKAEGSSKFENSCDEKQSSFGPFYLSSSEDTPDDVFTSSEQCYGQAFTQQDWRQSICMDVESLDTVDQSDVADSGFDQEMGDVEYNSPRGLTIQVIPPSCSGSEEHMLHSNKADTVSLLPKHPFMTTTAGELQQRLLQTDSTASQGTFLEQHEDLKSLNTNEVEAKTGSSRHALPLLVEPTRDLQLNPAGRKTEDIDAASCAVSTMDADILSKEADKHLVSRQAREHLKPEAPKEPESCEHWAKRRKLFKESKQWSSAGGSSITSDITEESVSEDTRSSMDMTTKDNEDRGFYTETFHSSAWIYQGDDTDPGVIPPSLNTRTRAVSIRERTVKISKGTGEYPWGFRIQFSKPIVVTEVDTNGSAEEAGLMVGDSVLAVNGTDVTSIPHSEAADLARQGPNVLTLTIGSDIARGPNTPRPACRGYLHKRTQSGLIKGWRKRWFVLTHDCCLFYYRHKRDEGKSWALSAVKLEGAEVGPDVSLGKPFVFKCRPQSGNRVYFFCATSNQEMKRWLEAMEKAIHPVTQNHVWMDVTRHNSNLPPLAVKNPECLGLLHKMDKNKDMWVQHYCILKDACLYLYSGIRATHAHGGIYLQGYTVREQPYGSKKSTIELKPPSDEFKTFHFSAENPNENKRWITAIRASVKKWLPLHQALQEYMNRPSEETRM